MLRQLLAGCNSRPPVRHDLRLHQERGFLPYTLVWAAHAGHHVRCQRMILPNVEWGFVSARGHILHLWQIDAMTRVGIPNSRASFICF